MGAACCRPWAAVLPERRLRILNRSQVAIRYAVAEREGQVEWTKEGGLNFSVQGQGAAAKVTKKEISGDTPIQRDVLQPLEERSVIVTRKQVFVTIYTAGPDEVRVHRENVRRDVSESFMIEDKHLVSSAVLRTIKSPLPKAATPMEERLNQWKKFIDDHDLEDFNDAFRNEQIKSKRDLRLFNTLKFNREELMDKLGMTAAAARARFTEALNSLEEDVDHVDEHGIESYAERMRRMDQEVEAAAEIRRQHGRIKGASPSALEIASYIDSCNMEKGHVRV
jgi:hypothetical protein